MELYYVIYVCISEKNNGHCKRIIGENNGQKIGALIIGKILSIIYQGLLVTWSPSIHATGYRILYTTGGNSYSVKIDGSSNNTYTLTGLKNGETYYCCHRTGFPQ